MPIRHDVVSPRIAGYAVVAVVEVDQYGVETVLFHAVEGPDGKIVPGTQGGKFEALIALRRITAPLIAPPPKPRPKHDDWDNDNSPSPF